MDGFGVPAAVVMVQGDRFLFANECFSQIVGLTATDLSTTSLLKIVRFPLNYRLDARPVPVTIRPLDQNLTIKGHVGFGKQGLANVVIPSQLHRATDLYKEQDRQWPPTCLSGQLPAERIVLDFAIEFIRAHSAVENHSAELEVKQIRENI
jgi:hypothetical protein